MLKENNVAEKTENVEFKSTMTKTDGTKWNTRYKIYLERFMFLLM